MARIFALNNHQINIINEVGRNTYWAAETFKLACENMLASSEKSNKLTK